MADNNTFYGYEMEEIEFDGTIGIIVKPKDNTNGKIVFKTEYWGAFPELELELLKRGFLLVHLTNKTRFANKNDCDRKAMFIEYVLEKYALDPRCILIGMSCGGAQAVNFAAKYPKLVSCIVIDAPVLNFLDYPGKYNKYESIWDKEFTAAYPGVKRPDIFSLEYNPINNISAVIDAKIPVIMLYGTEDMTVDYYSNGKLLEEAYSDYPELLTVIPRKFQGHHPHGLQERSDELAEFVMSKIN